MENVQVQLKKLTLSPNNVRKDPSDVTGLKTSIKEVGVLLPLIVTKGQGGNYEVVAGGRRLRALQELSKEKDSGFSVTTKVSCILCEDENAVKISTIENEARVKMRTIDRALAYANLFETGKTTEKIAHLFDVTVKDVQNEVKLAGVHPDIISAHRAQRLNLDEIRAFTTTADQSRQLEVYEGLSANDNLNKAAITRALKGSSVSKNSHRGTIVYNTYIQRGGLEEKDLFGDNSVLLQAELADEILREELQKMAKNLEEKEGWSWSECWVNPEFHQRYNFDEKSPKNRELNEDEKSKIDALKDEINEIRVGNGVYFSLTVEEKREVDARQEQINALEDDWSECTQQCGVIVSFSDSRGIEIIRGLVHPDDIIHEVDIPDENSNTSRENGEYTKKLQNELNEDKAHAIGLGLAKNPQTAVDFVMFQFVKSFFSQAKSLTLKTEQHVRTDELSRYRLLDIEEELQKLIADVDIDVKTFADFQNLDQNIRDRLVAYVAGSSVNLYNVHSRETAEIAEIVLPNIREAWSPDFNFFSQLKKAQLVAILHDIFELSGLEDRKKAQLEQIVFNLFNDGQHPDIIALSEEVKERAKNWCPDCLVTKQDEKEVNGLVQQAA